MHDLVGRAEAKGRGVADVELEDAQALVLHAGRLVGHGTADVIEDVVELVGLLELTHGGAPFRGRAGRGGRGGGLRPRGSSRAVSRGKPRLRDAQDVREQAQRCRARDDLAAHILADLALSELLAALRRGMDEVRLLEVLLAHDAAEPVRKRLLGHPASRSSILATKLNISRNKFNVDTLAQI